MNVKGKRLVAGLTMAAAVALVAAGIAAPGAQAADATGKPTVIAASSTTSKTANFKKAASGISGPSFPLVTSYRYPYCRPSSPFQCE
jgi:hypothetical protein